MKLKVYDKAGKKMQKEVTTKLFDFEVNPELIAESMYIKNTGSRQVSAKTKDRSEARGGGRKPWRQKGTGRARAGSIRSPIFRGGGVTFGPRGNENYNLSIPKKKKKKAFLSALGTKEAKNVALVSDFSLQKPSTKKADSLIERIGFDRNVLVVSDKMGDVLKKSFSNLPNVRLKSQGSINIYDVLWSEGIVFLGNSLTDLEKRCEVK